MGQVQYAAFRVGDLFENISRGTRLTKSNRVKGDIPLLTAGVGLGQGVAEFISETAGMTLHNQSMTIDMFGNVFWHDYPCYGDDNIHFFERDDLDSSHGLYIVAATQRAVRGYHYGKQFRMKDVNRLVIELPSITRDLPDWQTLAFVCEGGGWRYE